MVSNAEKPSNAGSKACDKGDQRKMTQAGDLTSKKSGTFSTSR